MQMAHFSYLEQVVLYTLGTFQKTLSKYSQGLLDPLTVRGICCRIGKLDTVHGILVSNRFVLFQDEVAQVRPVSRFFTDVNAAAGSSCTVHFLLPKSFWVSHRR